MSDSKIELQIDGVSSGPYTPEEVANLLDSGVINWNTPASADHEHWRPLRVIADREGDIPGSEKVLPPRPDWPKSSPPTRVYPKHPANELLGILLVVLGLVIVFTASALAEANGWNSDRVFPYTLLFLAGVAIYFAPTFIAHKKHHRNLTALTCLNIFAGWTLIGWVAALVWALYKERDPAPQK
jgi:hypothetical protein